MNILHISAHYGGGVGTVMSALVNNDPENKHTCTHLNNIPANKGTLFDIKMINESDIVICHVWNHPSMFEFLVNTKLPPCRLIIWSHISGLHAPDIYSTKLILHPDLFIFTSPVSYYCHEVLKLADKYEDKLDVVWSTYDMGVYDSVKREKHEGFNVGYIGTTSYGKLHSRFIEMCAAVKSNVKFLIASNDSQDHLKLKAKNFGVYNRFDFKGRVPCASKYLTSLEVFGYPLQPTHFGSCEQAIGEAMICGAVPVVLGNQSERFIVRHMETGLVTDNTKEYSKAIDFLYENPNELKRMSENAMIEAKKRYNINNTVKKWKDIFDKTLLQEKKEHVWSKEKMPPYFVFAISLGQYGRPFIDYVFSDLIGDSGRKAEAIQRIKNLYASNPAFLSESKGSVKQYLNYYPQDKYMREWADLL